MALRIATIPGPDATDSQVKMVDGFYLVGPGPQTATPAGSADSAVVENEGGNYLLVTLALAGSSLGSLQYLVGPNKTSQLGFAGASITSLQAVVATPPVATGNASTATPVPATAFTAVVTFLED